jgi:uncharacterized membrane protein
MPFRSEKFMSKQVRAWENSTKKFRPESIFHAIKSKLIERHIIFILWPCCMINLFIFYVSITLSLIFLKVSPTFPGRMVRTWVVSSIKVWTVAPKCETALIAFYEMQIWKKFHDQV